MSSNLIFGLGFKQANSGRTFLPSLTVCYELSLSFKLHTIQTTVAQKVQSSKRASHVTPFDALSRLDTRRASTPTSFPNFDFQLHSYSRPSTLSLSLSPSSSFDKSLAVSPSTLSHFSFIPKIPQTLTLLPLNTPFRRQIEVLTKLQHESVPHLRGHRSRQILGNCTDPKMLTSFCRFSVIYLILLQFYVDCVQRKEEEDYRVFRNQERRQVTEEQSSSRSN